MDVDENALLPIQKVGHVMLEQGQKQWLIEEIWLDQATGIIGGQPKCWKSWLSLDMAVSVASGTPCLGRFSVEAPGPALVYMAEDGPDKVRERVEGICQSRNLDIETLDLTLITSPVLRLDDENDRQKLFQTIDHIRPKLLLLDPLVRLHRLDENNSRDIAQLLGFLRELQRRFHCAVILTHHSSKRSHARHGQALRGSGDLHAFGDSNLYLTAKNDGQKLLAIEHRSAASPHEQLTLDLKIDPTRLQLGESAQPKTEVPLEERILYHLRNLDGPIHRACLRKALRVNNQRLGHALGALLTNNQVISSSKGITLS